jgi:hypothetical protein
MPEIYFDKESPDFNFGIWGKPERLAANRVVLCIMTEYGLFNDKRMQSHQINKLLISLQKTTGNFKESKTVKPKNSYIKKSKISKFITKPIKTIGPVINREYFIIMELQRLLNT